MFKPKSIEVLGYHGLLGIILFISLVLLVESFDPVHVGTFLSVNVLPTFTSNTYIIIVILIEIIGFIIGWLSTAREIDWKQKTMDGLCLSIAMVFFIAILGGIWYWCITYFGGQGSSLTETIYLSLAGFIIGGLLLVLVGLLMYLIQKIFSLVIERRIEIAIIMQSMLP